MSTRCEQLRTEGLPTRNSVSQSLIPAHLGHLLALRSARVHGVGPALKVHKEGIPAGNFGEIDSIGVTACHRPAVVFRLKRSALDGDLSTLLARFVVRLSVDLAVGLIRMLRVWRADLPQHPPTLGAGRHGHGKEGE